MSDSRASSLEKLGQELRAAGWVLGAALVVGCSSGGGTTAATSPDGGGSNVQSDAGTVGSESDGAAPDATSSGTPCATDSDCASFLAAYSPSPAGCAEAYCETLSATCGARPVDADDDTYRTADCTVPGLVITAGTDCNDHDPNLYPGHPEPCTTLADGGVQGLGTTAATGVCAAGTVSCTNYGTESACEDEVPACPANQSCVSGECSGVCGPGQTACSGTGGAPSAPANSVWSCSAGAWVAGASCSSAGTTCLGSADAGTAGAACQGSCAPGTTTCSGADGAPASPSGTVWTCSATGTWVGGTSCTSSNTTCTVSGSAGSASASCVGGCSAGETACSGSSGTPSSPANAVWSCSSSGTWVSTDTCANQTCLPTSGGAGSSCQGGCAPTQTRCGAASGGAPLYQTCTATGSWSAGVITIGECSVVCLPGQTQCNDPELLTCGAVGTWGAGVVVPGQCNASCAPGSTQGCAPGLTGCVGTGSGSQTCQANATWGTCSPTNCSPFTAATSQAWNQGNTLCGGGKSDNDFAFSCPAGAHPTGCVAECVSGCCSPASSSCDSSATLISSSSTGGTCDLHQGVSGCNSETMQVAGQCEY